MEIYKGIGEGTIDIGDVLEVLFEKKYQAKIPFLRRIFYFLGQSPKGEKVHINVTAHDRTGLLADIGSLARNLDINLIGIFTKSKSTNIAILKIRLRVFNFQQLKNFLESLPKIKNIIAVRRTTQEKKIAIHFFFLANILYWLTQPFVIYYTKDSAWKFLTVYFLAGTALSILVTYFFQSISKYLMVAITKVHKLWIFCMVMNVSIGALVALEKIYLYLPFHWIFVVCFIIIIAGTTFTEYYQYLYGESDR